MRCRILCIGWVALCSALNVSRGGAQSLASASARNELLPAATDSAAPWSGRPTAINSCVAAIPISEMEKQPVFLNAKLAASTSAQLTDQADLIASDVATELHALLTGADSSLAATAANMKWYAVPAELLVVARPNGEMSWRGFSQSGDSSAIRLLGAAFDAARRHGSATMIWPEGVHADSLVLRLALLPKSFFGQELLIDTVSKMPVRFAVFALPAPAITGVRSKASVQKMPAWPHAPTSQRVSGYVHVEFAVDSTGRADMSTFRDLWPEGTPRLTGIKAEYYSQFVNTIRQMESDEKFEPAHVGKCDVRAFTAVTYSFDGKRSTDRYSKW